MTPRLSGHFSIFGLVFFVLKSLLRIVRQWSREKIAILSLKPCSHVRILIYRTWAIVGQRYFTLMTHTTLDYFDLKLNQAYCVPSKS